MGDELDGLRKQIDACDERLLLALRDRKDVVALVGKYKKTRGLSSLDEKRWLVVLESRLARAKELGLSEDFVLKVYNLIHQYSLGVENIIKEL